MVGRRKLVFALVAAIAIWWLNGLRTSSTSIDLGVGAPSLTYSVTWGFGMTETLTVRYGTLPWQQWSMSSDIFKKPYNSGANIFRSTDNRRVYMRFGHSLTAQLAEFDMATSQFKATCYEADVFGPGVTEAAFKRNLAYVGRFLVTMGPSPTRGTGVAFVPANGATGEDVTLASACG